MNKSVMQTTAKQSCQPAVHGAFTVLGGFTLREGSWTTTLREIPIKDRTDVEAGHICTITKEGGAMTSESVRTFVDENLFPYLSFVFGRKIRYDQIMGGAWAIVPRQRKNIPRTLNSNWFLGSRHDVDLSSPFQAYCNLAHEAKTHWQRVIDHYAMSEEIMGTLGETANSRIGQLCRTGGVNTFVHQHLRLSEPMAEEGPEPETWKGNYQRNRNGRQGRTWCPRKRCFKQASQDIYNVRNQTMHLDLKADEDAKNAYHRWNSSQALIEILMLAKIGPDRKYRIETAYGKFEVMGQDMYKDIRKEALDLRQTESEPEAGKPE